jgi:hypothetical protein
VTTRSLAREPQRTVVWSLLQWAQCNTGNVSLTGTYAYPSHLLKVKKKVKLSRYTPWRHMGEEEVQLLLILNLGTRWG